MLTVCYIDISKNEKWKDENPNDSVTVCREVRGTT